MDKTNAIVELWFQSTEVPWGENESSEPHVYGCQGEGPRLGGSVFGDVSPSLPCLSLLSNYTHSFHGVGPWSSQSYMVLVGRR